MFLVFSVFKPNVSHLILAKADLSYPPPKGVLRVLVKNARELRAADFNLSGPSSDPYVVIEAESLVFGGLWSSSIRHSKRKLTGGAKDGQVGQQQWKSSVVEKRILAALADARGDEDKSSLLCILTGLRGGKGKSTDDRFVGSG